MAATRPAQRAYLRRMAVLMTLYLVTLVGAEWLFKRELVSGPLAYVLGVLPAIPVVGVFWALGRLLVEETDEFLRMLLVRQIIVATGFALSICTIWGFLESFDLVPHVDAYWAAVLWFGGLGLGGLVNRLTLGVWGQLK